MLDEPFQSDSESAPPPLDRVKLEQELLQPLSKRWMQRIRKGLDKRKPWERRADECKAFYKCSADFIFKQSHEDFAEDSPLLPSRRKFEFVLGKAFEFVAVFGPSLFYTVPHRRVTPRTLPPKTVAYVERMIGAQIAQYQQAMQQAQIQAQQAMATGVAPPPPPQMPPMLVAMQQALQQDRQRFEAQVATAEQMELWLNYTPQEQPGTLAVHGKIATVDAMVTGRGVLFPRPIRKPSGRLVTGLFREDPYDFVVDPCAKTYETATWVALRRRQRTVDVERRFQLPEGSLRKKATATRAYGESYEDGMPAEGMDGYGDEKDQFVYWEIFSKRGIGIDDPDRQPEADTRLTKALSDSVGRYAYLAIAPGVDYPLNAHPDFIAGNGTTIAPGTPESVAQLFAWPFESWRDDRFPCEVLDFYVDTDCPYPIAPLTPGMGYLKFLTYMMSRLANRIDSSCRDFVAASSAYYDEIRKALDEGEDLTLMRIGGGQKVSDLVGFLTQPQVNADAWRIMEAVGLEFARATGLNDLAYGGNPGGTQSRTAADAANKREATMIRPQYMQQTVEEWMSRAAGLEAMCARRYLDPQEIQANFGNAAAFVWGQSVQSQDMNAIVGEYEYRVDAGSMRRPNKEQLVANVNQIMPVLLPMYQGYAQQTGNVGPLNNLLQMLFDSIDLDGNAILMPPPPPPQPMQEAPPEQAPQEQAA